MLNPALTQRDIKLEVVKFLDKGEIQKCHKVCSNWKREFQVPQYMQSPVDPIRRGFQTIEINFDESFVGYNGMKIIMEAAKDGNNQGIKPRTIIFDPKAPDDATLLRTSSQIIKDEFLQASAFRLLIRLGYKKTDYKPIFDLHFPPDFLNGRKLLYCRKVVIQNPGKNALFDISKFAEPTQTSDDPMNHPFYRKCLSEWEHRVQTRNLRLF